MSMKKKDAGRQAPNSPMPRDPFSRSENRDFGNLEPPDPAAGPAKSGFPIPDSRPNPSRESGQNSEYFPDPGPIGIGKIPAIFRPNRGGTRRESGKTGSGHREKSRHTD